MYAPKLTGGFSPDEPPVNFKRLGLRDVSVFNGFCKKHDTVLFSCLENKAFQFTRKQLFMLAYRAAARECYLKRKQCESLPTLEQIKSMHGITEQIAYIEEILIHQAASLRGAEECEALKAKLDDYLVSESWDRLVTHAILFPNTPTLSACFVFQPYHDMNGIQLQDYENLQAEMSYLAISLIPIEQNGGAAIFSWLDSASHAPRRFYESVLEGKNITTSVIHAVLDNSENFAISPSWYEPLPQEAKNYLFSRMGILEASIIYSAQKRPDEDSPNLGNWGTPSFAQF